MSDSTEVICFFNIMDRCHAYSSTNNNAKEPKHFGYGIYIIPIGFDPQGKTATELLKFAKKGDENDNEMQISS